MLTNNDIEWLVANYPELTPTIDGTKISGVLEFTGAYNSKGNKFTIIATGDTSLHPGVILQVSYNISIEPNPDRQRLPRLFIDGVTSYTADRHFYPANKSACVCGVIEEAEFIEKGFNFKIYLEEYVIPFLYGQKYYDQYNKWPWPDYAHDTTGALESYSHASSSKFTTLTLDRLKVITHSWGRVRSILINRKIPKGHLPCFCKKQDHIKRCHPDAWEGLKKLYSDVHSNTEILDLLKKVES